MLKLLVLVILVLWVTGVFSRRRAARRAARNIREMGAKTFGGPHEYREARLADFPHLDAPFYDRTAAELGAEGFTVLADVEDVTMTESGGALMPAMIRTLVAEDGALVAGCFHARAKNAGLEPGPRSFRVVEITTELQDGRFLVTSNATSSAGVARPPEIAIEFLPAETSAAGLAQRHRERLRELLASTPDATPRRAHSFAEVVEQQQRMDALKARFRQQQAGMFSREELERMAPSVDSSVKDAVASELRKLDGR